MLLSANNTLGEGPIWDGDNDRLIWVDILEKNIHTLNLRPINHTVYPAPGMVGCVGLTDHGRWVVAIEHKIGLFNPESMEFQPLVELETDIPRNRFNDGKCAPNGSFIVGSMDMDERAPNGALYQVRSNASPEILLEKNTISNGIAWSPDQKVIYTIDTPTMLVMAHDFNPVTGALENPHVAIRIPAGIGFPDGMTSDTDGNLWIAMWGGAMITKWDPRTGKQLGQLSVPCLNPTCCVFGGEDRDTLFVTSARVGMTENQLAQYPLSGSLFSARIDGVTGPTGFVFKE